MKWAKRMEKAPTSGPLCPAWQPCFAWLPIEIDRTVYWLVKLERFPNWDKFPTKEQRAEGIRIGVPVSEVRWRWVYRIPEARVRELEAK